MHLAMLTRLHSTPVDSSSYSALIGRLICNQHNPFNVFLVIYAACLIAS